MRNISFFRKYGKSFAEFLLEGEKNYYSIKTPNSVPPLETDHHAPLGEKKQMKTTRTYEKHK